MDATELLVWGTVVHLIVDWLFQNEWIAEHKPDLRHPAGYLHAGAHGLALLLVFPPLAALALGVSHLLIDTRRPLAWWARVMSQTVTGPIAAPIHIWRDQTLHIATVAAAALIVAR
jgi:hypothetical protein